jgi:uncharacterized protein YdeI (YjbR/CyaY-like superfamily)
MSEEHARSDPEGFEAGDTLEIPAQFLKALAIDAAANDAFDRLGAADQKEFIDWVVAEKDAAARERRAREALGLLKNGRRPGA